jgi:hypothetical protein
MCDAVPDSLVNGAPSEFRDDLVRLLGKKQIFQGVIDLVRYAVDASPYRVLPKAVVPRNVDDVANIPAYRRETGRHATFRAAGTSLNGQSRTATFQQTELAKWDFRTRPASLPIACLPARGTNTPGTAIDIGRGLTNKT